MKRENGPAGLTGEQIAEYFHRSYTSADGLWFMKVEERHGFEEALETDRLVWEIVPKIQARTLRSMLDADGGLEGLKRCLAAKLELEGFEFQIDGAEGAKEEVMHGGEGKGELRITVARCPWHDLMAKAGRVALSEKVGTTICSAENRVWASEFEGEISFGLESQICKGDPACVLRFTKSH